MKKVFIQSNKSQLSGAKLAQFAIERNNKAKDIDVEIILVDDLPMFKNFEGHTFTRKPGDERTYDLKDLQSFTLTRFMPPELMNFQGKAVVIDPDIFILVDIEEVFQIDMKGNAIAACKNKMGTHDSSVMLLDCSKLTHWKVSDFIEQLKTKKIKYSTIMNLENETVTEIPRIWNSIDVLNEETKLIHTSMRLTQPWKTGLPVDFTINPMQKIFGIIPREPIHKLLGKYPTHYKKHPDQKIEDFFFILLKDAMKAGVVTNEFLKEEVQKKHIRKDVFDTLEKY